jgi:hypothetical protein
MWIRIRNTGVNNHLLSSDQIPKLGSEFHLGRKNPTGEEWWFGLLLPWSELILRSSDASLCYHNTDRNAQLCKPLPVRYLYKT